MILKRNNLDGTLTSKETVTKMNNWPNYWNDIYFPCIDTFKKNPNDCFI